MLLEHAERTLTGIPHEGEKEPIAKSLFAPAMPRHKRIWKTCRADAKSVFIEVRVSQNAPEFASSNIAVKNRAPELAALGFEDSEVFLLASIGLRTDRILDGSFPRNRLVSVWLSVVIAGHAAAFSSPALPSSLRQMMSPFGSMHCPWFSTM